jgi:hypothetical protein
MVVQPKKPQSRQQSRGFGHWELLVQPLSGTAPEPSSERDARKSAAGAEAGAVTEAACTVAGLVAGACCARHCAVPRTARSDIRSSTLSQRKGRVGRRVVESIGSSFYL